MFLKDLWRKSGFRLEGITICTPFFEASITQNNNNKIASWQLYVELITRVSTQYLADYEGDEETALESIYRLFDITRDIMKQYGREAETFSMLSTCLLNLVIRPFTSKWHKISKDDMFDETNRKVFRNELYNLQIILCKFSALLWQMSNVDNYESINFDEIEKYVMISTNEMIEYNNH